MRDLSIPKYEPSGLHWGQLPTSLVLWGLLVALTGTPNCRAMAGPPGYPPPVGHFPGLDFSYGCRSLEQNSDLPNVAAVWQADGTETLSPGTADVSAGRGDYQRGIEDTSGRDFSKGIAFLRRGDASSIVAAVGYADSVELWFSSVHKVSGQPVSVAYVRIVRPILNCELGETIRLVMRTVAWSQSGRIYFVGVNPGTQPIIKSGDSVLILASGVERISDYAEDSHLQGAFLPSYVGFLTMDPTDLAQYPRIQERFDLDRKTAKANASPSGTQDLSRYLVRTEAPDSLSLREMIERLGELRAGREGHEK